MWAKVGPQQFHQVMKASGSKAVVGEGGKSCAECIIGVLNVL